MEEFFSQILPWLLAGGGIGAFINRLIENKFAVQREERTRAFDVRKEVYGKLSGATIDFIPSIARAATTAANSVKEGVAKILDELDTSMASYVSVAQENIDVLVKNRSDEAVRTPALEKIQEAGKNFYQIRNRLVKEMQKDLGIVTK